MILKSFATVALILMPSLAVAAGGGGTGAALLSLPRKRALAFPPKSIVNRYGKYATRLG
jgi:hypothetical protein